MNECAESGMCLNGRCVNEMGKYRCECDEDFEPNPTNTACIGKKVLMTFIERNLADSLKYSLNGMKNPP